ncbi:MAG: hypothetical protein R6V31_08965 [Halohasta sp.]
MARSALSELTLLGSSLARSSLARSTLSTLSTRQPGPAHGRLARLQYTLRELKEAANPEAVDHIDDAIAHIKAYRKTVEGV